MSEKILSCFIDESGDFGEFDSPSSYYIVSFVLHEQFSSIQGQINGLENRLSISGLPHHALHTAPLLRREGSYRFMRMKERKQLFNLLFNFARKIPIRYCYVKIKKSECYDAADLEIKLTKAITNEIRRTESYWYSFDKIIIYYDDGQRPVKRILHIIFSAFFSNAEFRKVAPADYKLFQVADLICTLTLVRCKIESGVFSNSEQEFFHSPRDFKKEYWRKIEKLRL